MSKVTLSLVACLSLSLLSGCSDSDNNVTVNQPPVVETTTTIADVAADNESFSTLLAALQATGLDQVLDDPSKKFTVFAPTNAAFAALGEGAVASLLEQPEVLTDILTYHVLEGEVDAQAALSSAGSTVEMVNGDKLALSFNGESLQLNGVTVTSTDLKTDNGIIHVIDAVLMPPEDADPVATNIAETAVAAGSFNTLVSLLQLTGLDAVVADDSKKFTVFAPTDEAFAKIDATTLKVLANNPEVLKQILLQHVVVGEVDSITAYSLAGNSAETASGADVAINIDTEMDRLMFGNANIIDTDIVTSNGIIHVIDSVVIGDVELPQALGSIVGVATNAGSFNTLIAALQATGLDTTLADINSDFTVFAPTDAAFAALGDDTINALLQDTETLSNILLYHVIASQKVQSDAAVSLASSSNNQVEMANGSMATLTLSDGKLMIDGATITTADVMADNGVIHVIDAVITPSE
ncbi:fasciclin domain-containing protein (plasmid) [Pseudoalteromonas sp. T1lg65]|uniref:fasciclin domain-containing protein n=1 Tax=Pseudoalteromonas sp. T1lg65 TaxID=2077101 RepID=UPI003F7A32E6